MSECLTHNKIILFDAFELVYGYGKSLGIYRYALSVLREMVASVPTGYELLVITNSLNNEDFLSCINGATCSVRCISIGQMSSVKKILWQWIGAPILTKRYKADVYFNPKGFSPGVFYKPQGYKILVTIHDLIPFWYDEGKAHNSMSNRYVVHALKKSAKWADAILADSEATRSEIIHRTKRKEKISVVYCGLDEEVDVSSSKSPLPFPYVFALGSHLPHKNLKVLTAANAIYRERTKQPLPLVVCTDAKMPPGITVVSNLSEKELATWYYHATCFIFPSLIEGFGFPPLEAMQHLTPVIAADTPIQHEILGDACLYFNPHDPGDLADKIEMLSANPLLAEKLLKAGQGICKKYDWKVSGQEIWKIIKGLTSD